MSKDIVPVDQYDIFLENYLNGGVHEGKRFRPFNVKRSALVAGYALKTAEAQGKRILETALRKQSEKTEAMKESDSPLLEKVGLTKEEVAKRIEFWATQERDGNVAYKFLQPFAKELGIDYSGDNEQKNIVPIQINMGEKPSVEPDREL